jgi:subtilisin family serine protease
MDHLTAQVQKIIDESGEKRLSVIVQMRADDEATERLIQTAAEVHRRRTMTVSARELLPSSKTDLDKLADVGAAKLTASAARKILTGFEVSLAMQLGASVFAPVVGAAFSAGLKALLESEVVQKSVERSLADRTNRKSSEWQFDKRDLPKFASSGTMVLEIDRDSLGKLPQQAADANIQDIFPNRTLRLPRLVDVKSVPQAVQDEKTSSWGIHRINALSTWGAYGARGKDVRVAVLDTGVDPEHPDLKGKVKDWAEFDGSGFEVPGSQAHDTDRHGTHCAGTVAGGNASGAWIGVAPEAEIAGGLVLPKGSGTYAQILAGIDWAIRKKVDVISLSLGALTLDVTPPDPYTRALLSANAAGIPVVTAIGNEGSQTTGTPGNDWFAFAVGATDYRDRPAGFSGGRTHVIRESRYLKPEVLPVVYSKPEVSAPGVAIRSAVPGGAWATFNGTSMATPHVAGALALLLSATSIRSRVADPQRAFLLQDLLTGSVEELGEAGQDHRYGYGRIDVLRAIGFARERGF